MTWQIDKFEFYKILRVVKMQRSLLAYWHHRGCEDSISEEYDKVKVDSEKLIEWIEEQLGEDS